MIQVSNRYPFSLQAIFIMKIHHCWLLSLLLSAGLLYSAPADACSPCPEDATLSQQVENADLIALVRFIEVARGDRPTQSESIAVEVVEVIKGEPRYKKKLIDFFKAVPDDKRIILNSWAGMCDYGITISHNSSWTWLIFVEWSSHEDQYMALRCGEKQALVTGDSVTLDGKKVPLTDLSKALGLEREAE